MSEEQVDAVEERSFRVAFLKCTVTNDFDKCINVKLGEIAREDGKVAEIFGNFSERALASMLLDLRAAPDPVLAPSHEAVQEETPYQWGVLYADGQQMQQFPVDGKEMPFAQIPLDQVAEFWIVPKHDELLLPWYGLSRTHGFIQTLNDQVVALPLARPDGPFTFNYYRRVSVTAMTCNGSQETLPPHVVQVFGWQTAARVYEIGIEADGSYSVWKDEPL